VDDEASGRGVLADVGPRALALRVYRQWIEFPTSYDLWIRALPSPSEFESWTTGRKIQRLLWTPN
jgi:hypothetical protein